MTNEAKRGRGRPSLTGETGERFQVTIPPSIAAKLRALGDGSLSRGIIRSAGPTRAARKRV
jgi:hypothetical protein